MTLKQKETNVQLFVQHEDPAAEYRRLLGYFRGALPLEITATVSPEAADAFALSILEGYSNHTPHRLFSGPLFRMASSVDEGVDPALSFAEPGGDVITGEVEADGVTIRWAASQVVRFAFGDPPGITHSSFHPYRIIIAPDGMDMSDQVMPAWLEFSGEAHRSLELRGSALRQARSTSGLSLGWVGVHPTAELVPNASEEDRRAAGTYAELDSDGAPWYRRVGTDWEPATVALAAVVQLSPGVDPETLAERAALARRRRITDRLARRRRAEVAAEEAEVDERRRAAERRLETFLGRTVDTENIPALPFVPHGLASSRRWGIEIESGGARGVAAPAEWDRKRDGSLRSAYEGFVEVEDFEPYTETVEALVPWHACPQANRHRGAEPVWSEARNEWIPAISDDYLSPTECPSCGIMTTEVLREPRTIRHQGGAGDCAEFVSPILVSMHSNGLEELLGELSTRPQNDTAGVHVHVEASDLTGEQINTLVYGYGMIEAHLTASYRRETRSYCRAITATEVRAAAALKGHDRFETGERYTSVNRYALDAHGTIEFRSMGPVYDYDHLIRWAMFCRELVNVVAAGATQEEFARAAGSWDKVLLLLAKYGKEYVRAVVYQVTGETGEWAKLTKERPTAAPAEYDNAAANDLLAALARMSRPLREVVRNRDESLVQFNTLTSV